MLEGPSETIWKLLLRANALFKYQQQDLAKDTYIFAYHELYLTASIRTAIEMGLLDALNKSQRPKGATGLASSTGGDKLLIVISPLVSSC